MGALAVIAAILAGAASAAATPGSLGLNMTLVQETSPKTTKVELSKCEMNVC